SLKRAPKEMARIIVALTDPTLPFGDAAARRYYVLLQGLAERGHRVTAFAVCSDATQAAHVAELFPAPRHDIRLYRPPVRRGLGAKFETWRRPYSYMFSQDLRGDLRAELARGVDVLHLEQTWAGWLGIDYADRALVNVQNLYAIDLSDRPPDSM